MTVSIDIGEVLFDVADKSHASLLASVPDPEERYRYEAGTEKRDTVLRCLTEAVGRMDVALEGLTLAPHTAAGDNSPIDADGAVLEWVFPPSARRYGSQAGAMASLMHSFLVNCTLGLFCTAVGRADDAKGWAALSTSDLEAVTLCAHTKTRPVRSKPYM